MKYYHALVLIKHRVQASPREVIENYVDYGHEIFAHGKYASSNQKHVSKISRVIFRHLSATEKEVIVPVRLLGGLIRANSFQRVSLRRWDGIVSQGTLYGLPAGSRWFIWRDSETVFTHCWVIYEISLPWCLFFLEPLVRWAVRHLRARIWEEDRIMLERRDRLIKKGFGDWGKRPSVMQPY